MRDEVAAAPAQEHEHAQQREVKRSRTMLGRKARVLLPGERQDEIRSLTSRTAQASRDRPGNDRQCQRNPE